MSATPEPLRVAAFVGTRADLGPLSSVLLALDDAQDIDLRLLTGVAYSPRGLAAELATTKPAEDWEKQIHALAEPLDTVSVEIMLDHGPQIAAGMGRLLREVDPQVLVVLGDRWELLYVVPGAFLDSVPIVHLHGGEVTEGAVDERVRHAVTKLADQHCVASQDSARRLRQMGEPADRVHVTGAPGLDRLATAEAFDDDELAAVLGAPVKRPVALFTYHPPTARGENNPGRWASEALDATLEHCGTVVATYPGMDAGRDEVIAALHAAAAADPRVVVVESLGSRYPRVLASVDVVVGNSSSGIIEAATLHRPAVNIGERQQGRLRGDNVHDSSEGRQGVSAAVAAALSPDGAERARRAVNPYGEGDASRRILDIVRAAPGLPRMKPFIDSRVEDA